MKRAFALILIFTFLFCACTPQCVIEEPTTTAASTEAESLDMLETMEFTGLHDPALLRYVEDDVYANLIDAFGDELYFIENVEAIYISQEYLDEMAYNAQENIFFGYSLAELDAQFEGTRYVFSLGDDGHTTVQAFEAYDDTYERVLKNVAIGAGVILLCVTVSVVTGGAAPAVSLIFAASAKTASVMALSGGLFSGVTAGVVTGIQTKDFDQAMKAAALSGSEAFKWGAITGAITGGAGKAIQLKGATANGLTMNQAAAIQKQSKYPLDVIKQFHSVEEANVFMNEAGLKTIFVNGKTQLVPADLDLNFLDELGRTNLQRMAEGLNPLDAAGKSFEWHHIGQKADGTLALLTQAQHDNPALHGFIKDSEINRAAFALEKRAINSALSTLLQ